MIPYLVLWPGYFILESGRWSIQISENLYADISKRDKREKKLQAD